MEAAHLNSCRQSRSRYSALADRPEHVELESIYIMCIVHIALNSICNLFIQTVGMVIQLVRFIF